MSNSPSGTLTFLFTDIGGSTALWERHPEAMQPALARHDTLLSGAIANAGGRVFSTAGDAFCAIFATTREAVLAALAIQRAVQEEAWPEATPIRVRIALHAGAAELRDGDYFGPPLNRIARLRDIAHGGQILLSAAAAELVRDSLPAGVALRDLGTHRLKDLTSPERVYQIAAPDLETHFPALRSLDSRVTNLPIQRSPLIGREHELTVARSLLREAHRGLLTVTGPGGTGKTHLAVQIAAEMIDATPDGICFVSLAPIADPELVPSAIARTLGLHDAAGGSPLELLTVHLREKEMLLVLDNFEHLLPAATAVADLLAACPRLTLLVTSRAVLRLRGEQELPVPPLSLPAGEETRTEVLAASSAVRLFVERAREVRPDFTATPETLPLISAICARLDGLPLAIELAAARTRLLTPHALLERLTTRLPLLTGGARDLPERQQTLRTTIAWSYDLLTPAQQLLFRRLSVFTGGCTLDAAEVVCAPDLPGPDVLDGLTGLTEQSLLRPMARSSDEPRFGMLETVREFAVEILDASDEASDVAGRHARHFLALAEEAATHLNGPDQLRWLDRLEADHNNLQAALGCFLDANDFEMAGRATAALQEFWYFRGHSLEGHRWSERVLRSRERLALPTRTTVLRGAARLALRLGESDLALDHAEAAVELARGLDDPDALPRALCVLVAVLHQRGDVQGAAPLALEALEHARTSGDTLTLAWALHDRAMNIRLRGNAEAAIELMTESLALRRALGDVRGIAMTLNRLAQIERSRGNSAHAARLYDESLALYRQLRDRGGIAWTLDSIAGLVIESRGDLDRAIALSAEARETFNQLGDKIGVVNSLLTLGQATQFRGDPLRAAAVFEEALALYRAMGEQGAIAGTLLMLGVAAITAGDTARAGVAFRESLHIQRAIGVPFRFSLNLAALATLAAQVSHHERAARLFGAQEAIDERTGSVMPQPYRAMRDRFAGLACTALGDDAYATANAAGRALTLDQAIAEALDENQP